MLKDVLKHKQKVEKQISSTVCLRHLQKKPYPTDGEKLPADDNRRPSVLKNFPLAEK